MTRLSVDVCVVGSGASGMAAAVGAARRGGDVLLAERYGFLGGMGTAAAIGTFCGMYSSGPEPAPITSGFGWDVVSRLCDRRSAYWFDFGRTYLVHYDADVLKRVYDDLARAAGVRVLCHGTLADVRLESDRVAGATFLTQGDPIIVDAKQWIDASGDAVLSHRAGAATVTAARDELQAATLVFRMANVDVAAARSMPRSELNDRMRADTESGAFVLPRTSGGFYPTTHAGEVVINMTRVHVDGTDAFDLTEGEAAARAQVGLYAAWLQARVPGFARAYVSAIGTTVGLRETRRLAGRTVLTADDLRAGTRSDFDLGEGAWPFELHEPGSTGTRLEWLPDGVVYGIPIGAALPVGIDNLLVVGRCMSTTHDAQASTRVMGTCFSVGEAAGWTAAMAAAAGTRPGAVRRAELDGLRAWRAESSPPDSKSWIGAPS